jgi:predicted MFS family arabinose efflux permease
VSSPVTAPLVRHSSLGLLRRRDFAWFWAGQSISKVGNGIYQIGLAWSVYQLTGSTADMGIVLSANCLPEISLALVGGTLADRLPRRTVLLAADSVAGLVTGSVAVASAQHDLSMPLLVAAAILLGAVTAFFRPAYSAMNSDLIPQDDYRAANALLSVSGNVARVLGPAIGGLAYGIGGTSLAFGLDAASFAVAAGAMLVTRTRCRPGRRKQESMIREVRAGLRYAVTTRWLLLILAISMIANLLCLAPFFVLLPELLRIHHHGASTLGVLTSVEVLAGLAVAMVIGRLRSIEAGPALLLLASAIGAGTIILGLMADQLAALFLGVSLVGAGLSFDIIENTIIQELVPAELLSRVYGVNMVVSFALLPLGYAAAGFLARWAGSSWVLACGGAILIASCLGTWSLRTVRDLGRTRC